MFFFKQKTAYEMRISGWSSDVCSSDLETNRELIARRAGRSIEIVAIAARDRHKDRGVDLSAYRWEDDMGELVAADDVDVVVEVIGGADGPALLLARRTLTAGKARLTRNKAMIDPHGRGLAGLNRRSSH